jgi:hypothetical protein
MEGAQMASPAEDVLSGAKAIAEFIGESERRTHYLLDRGLLPAGQMGTRWVGSKKRIAQHYAELTAGKAA